MPTKLKWYEKIAIIGMTIPLCFIAVWFVSSFIEHQTPCSSNVEIEIRKSVNPEKYICQSGDGVCQIVK